MGFSFRVVPPIQGACFAGGADLHQALEVAFGPLPVKLSKKHIERLKGMVACNHKSLTDVIGYIEVYECIEIKYTD